MSTSNEALTRNDHSDRGDDNLRTAYEQLCLSYRAIDDFRSKLLGFLPFVTGAGVLALLGPLKAASQTLLAPIGAFGFLVTLGLFFFEIHGIRKCHSLINNGKRLECKLNVTDGGQFCERPIAIVNEPFAAGFIYPTVGATWLYVALNTIGWPLLWASIGFVATIIYDRFWLPIVEPPVKCPERSTLA